MHRSANGGLLYQCNYCAMVDRKGRLEDHILKAHVPVENVPFYCKLCLFRSQDRAKFYHHLANYSRHKQAEAKVGSVNYHLMLVKAAAPRFITDHDMRPVSREEGVRDNTLPDWCVEAAPPASQPPSTCTATRVSVSPDPYIPEPLVPHQTVPEYLPGPPAVTRLLGMPSPGFAFPTMPATPPPGTPLLDEALNTPRCSQAGTPRVSSLPIFTPVGTRGELPTFQMSNASVVPSYQSTYQAPGFTEPVLTAFHLPPVHQASQTEIGQEDKMVQTDDTIDPTLQKLIRAVDASIRASNEAARRSADCLYEVRRLDRNIRATRPESTSEESSKKRPKH